MSTLTFFHQLLEHNQARSGKGNGAILLAEPTRFTLPQLGLCSSNAQKGRPKESHKL
jgi:hypothetical protein